MFACLFACVCVCVCVLYACVHVWMKCLGGKRGGSARWLMRLGTCGPLDLCDACLVSHSFFSKESAKLEMFKSVLCFSCSQNPGLVGHWVQESVECAYWTGTLCLTWTVLIWCLGSHRPFFSVQCFFFFHCKTLCYSIIQMRARLRIGHKWKQNRASLLLEAFEGCALLS